MRNKKIILTVISVAMIACFAGCSKTSAASSSAATQETSVAPESLMAQCKLTDEQKRQTLSELGAVLRQQMMAADSNADLRFVIYDDGGCAYEACGTMSDESISGYSDVATFDDVDAMFEEYLVAGMIDIEGNLVGYDDATVTAAKESASIDYRERVQSATSEAASEKLNDVDDDTESLSDSNVDSDDADSEENTDASKAESEIDASNTASESIAQ